MPKLQHMKTVFNILEAIISWQAEYVSTEAPRTVCNDHTTIVKDHTHML